MLFNSVDFLIFFPIVVIVYYLLPARIKYIWLLIASYYFYMGWNATYALLIAASTVTTYGAAILISKIPEKKKLFVGLCIAFNLAILFLFKYFNFFLENINFIVQKTGRPGIENPFYFMLPVGISFYTFQALGYIIDVYRGEIEPESNLFKYALFVSFFPQLVAGPIERSKNLLEQINNIDKLCKLNFERIVNGLIYMLYGFFLKMVIADRVSIMVDTVFNNHNSYGGVELLCAALGFTLQIYCDFSSYSTIAIGAAEVMGFSLMENFNAPYHATSIADYWRRWHISLSTWFRDYVYIPLGGNRCSKARKNFNLTITFLISGLWHGANWTYIIWGMYHAALQIIGSTIKPFREKTLSAIGFNIKSRSFLFYQRVVTFIFITIGFVIFRASSLRSAVSYLYHMVTNWNPWGLIDGETLYSFGLDRAEWAILLVSCFIVFLVDSIRVKTSLRIDQYLVKQGAFTRCAFVVILFMMIFVYGIYGAGYDAQQFIYFQF